MIKDDTINRLVETLSPRLLEVFMDDNYRRWYHQAQFECFTAGVFKARRDKQQESGAATE